MNLLQLVFLLFSTVVCNAANITWKNSQQTVINATFREFRFSNEEVKQAFEKFKLDYNRVYETEEEEKRRYSAFVDNFVFVKNVNCLYARGKSSYSATINRFSDMTKNEIKGNKEYIRSIKLPQIKQKKNFFNFNFRSAVPKHLDWRDYNYVTPVKDQGKCGNCYAFAAVGCLESHLFRKTGILQSLSEQQIVDCGLGMGCDGGKEFKVYEYIRDNGGINTDSDYPYASGKKPKVNFTCKFNKHKITARVYGYVNVEPNEDEEVLKHAVATVGPISVGIDSRHKEFYHYRKGILQIPACETEEENLTHAGIIIGYGVEGDIPYWLIKNSWGTKWGIEGFYKLRRNANNMCGIATVATYPLV